MTEPVLQIERPDEATAMLTLNRPQRRNALSIELLESLCRELDTLAAEPRVRVVLLRGAGPVFCAGLDLVEAAQVDLAERSSHGVARTFQTLCEMPTVTIAAAHGAAYAGGAGLMACCDFVVASDDLRIAFPEVRRGLVPALAAVALGSRLTNSQRRNLVLSGEPFDAARALSIGLVDRVVPAEQLMATAQTVAAAILQGAPEAIRQTKRLLRELEAADRRQLFDRALEHHNAARSSAEACEGMLAFREHRDPQWPTCIE